MSPTAEDVGSSSSMAGRCRNWWPKAIMRKFCLAGYTGSKEQVQKLAHPMKVGVALGIASLLILLKGPDEWLGSNAIWAVMTVVVVFEASVGATISKAMNRCVATGTAGFLALGVEQVADFCGHPWEAVFIGASVMVVGVICTSMRFMPKMKAKYDYGLVIFMLTYSLILVSGYRTEDDVTVAWVRLFVILVASVACMIISMAIFPAWVGTDLHNALLTNFNDLAFTIEECASDFVKGALCQKDLEAMNYETTPRETILAKFNAVIGSGASFDTMAKQAIWEPCHGNFRFCHPWAEYVKVGSAIRQCALAVLTLDGCLHSGMLMTPSTIPATIRMEVIFAILETSKLVKELGDNIRDFQKCGEKQVITKAMRHASQSLQTAVHEHLRVTFTTKVVVPVKMMNPSFWQSLATQKSAPTSPKRPIRRTSSCSAITGERSPASSSPPPLRVRPKIAKPPKSPNGNKRNNGDRGAQPPTVTVEGFKSVSLATISSLLNEIVKRLDAVVQAVEELGSKAKFDAHVYETPSADDIV